MSRMAPTPIRTAPSSAPLEAMVTKQQNHIDELVTKNRGLEVAVQKLQVDVTSERARYEDALQKVKAQYDNEKKKWKEDSNMLQGLWHISYLREVVKVENAGKTIMDMKDELRLSRLATLQRDYQLEMFRAKESERDDRIGELEDALEAANWDKAEAEAQFAAREKEKVSFAEQLETQLEELLEAAEEQKQTEKALHDLRKQHATLLNSSTTDSTSLERIKLQLEGTKASLKELQQKYAELERSNTDLVGQLEKWRTLENRDDAELESLRKRKIELEVEVNKLRQDAETREEKFRTKILKYKSSLEEHVDAYNDSEATVEQQRNEIEQLKERLSLQDDEEDTLRQQLETAKKAQSTQPKNKAEVEALKEQLRDKEQRLREMQAQLKATKKAAKRIDPADVADMEEADGHTAPSPVPRSSPHNKAKPKPRPRPVPQKRPPTPSPSDDDSIQEIMPPPSAVPKPKSAKNAKPSVDDDDEIEVEDVAESQIAGPSKNKAKGKMRERDSEAELEPATRARKPQNKAKIVITEDEIDTAPLDPGESSAMGKKRRAEAVDDEQEYSPPPKPKKRSKKNAEGEERTTKAPKKPAPAKTSKSKKNSFLNSDNEDEVAQPKKQKRKINLNSQKSLAAPPKLDLPFAPQGDKSLSFDIPTELSPVKDSGGKPRAVSALGKNISSLMGNFPGRR